MLRTRLDPRSRARNRYNRAMRLVRRAHLYAGLFMVPWVFLYGGTALLFNHPWAFPDQELRTIAPADVAGTPLADFPPPRVLAGRVVEAINAAGRRAARRGISPGPTRGGRLRAGSTLPRSPTASASTPSGSTWRRVRGPSGRPPSVGAAPEAAAPFVTRGGLRLDPPPLEAVTRAMPQVLSRIGLPAEGLSVVPSPEECAGRGPKADLAPAPEFLPDRPVARMAPRAAVHRKTPVVVPTGGPGDFPARPAARLRRRDGSRGPS